MQWPQKLGASELNGRATVPDAVLLVSLASRRVALQPRAGSAGSTDHRPVLQDLDVITAVRGFCSGHATFVAECLDRNSRSDLVWDGICGAPAHGPEA